MNDKEKLFLAILGPLFLALFLGLFFGVIILGAYLLYIGWYWTGGIIIALWVWLWGSISIWIELDSY